MKTTATIIQALLALTIALSIVSCKKDKTNPTPPPVEVKTISLTDLKALSTSASVKVPDGRKISGIVISDAAGKNIDNKTVVLQDAASQTGIVITFDAAQTFASGDQLEVTISNQTLAQVNGEIELTNVPAANAKKTGTGVITAKATTIADINTNKTAWDGTLVTITATELSGGNGKFTGALIIKDASGASTTNVLAGAAFENTAYPVSVSAITGIVRLNNTDARVDIRKAADISIGAISRVITDDFSNVKPSSPLEDPYSLGVYNNYTNSYNDFSGSANIPWTAYAQGAYVLPGSKYDAGFTTAGRNYVYIANDYQNNERVQGGVNQIATNEQNGELKGLKTVSVTFAGTSSTKTTIFLGNEVPVNPFNSATDFFQIGIGAIDVENFGDGGQYEFTYGGGPSSAYFSLNGVSAKQTKNGVFYTYTYTIPTKDQMVAAGIDPSKADTWLANPNIVISNQSNLHDNLYFIAPILIEKVVFGY